MSVQCSVSRTNIDCFLNGYLMIRLHEDLSNTRLGLTGINIHGYMIEVSEQYVGV